VGTSAHPSALATAVRMYLALAVILFVTHGFGAVGVLTAVAVLVASYFARRRVEAEFGDQYARHGDRMD
jgi:protein-S-isoprenylcysteine O-methyltransferase Ste14